MSHSPQPGVYRKGHETRVADNAAQAVQLAFDGYQRETPQAVAAEFDRAALQARAKELGIKANQSSEALAEQIAAHAPEVDEVASGGERPSPDLSYVSGLAVDVGLDLVGAVDVGLDLVGAVAQPDS